MRGQSFGLKFRRSVVGLTLLVGAALPLQAGSALALVPPAAPTENAVLVNNINLSFLVPPSIDPSGVVYLADRDTLLVADSEVDEETGNLSCIPPVPPVSIGVNLFEVTRTGTLVATGVSPEVGLDGLPTDPTNKEPSGLAYNPANKHVFISNDNQDRVYEISAGIDGLYGTPDDSMSWFSTNVPGLFNASDPEDVAFDPISGDLFIAGGIGSVDRDVFRIDAGVNGIFDGLPINGGDDSISSFPTAGYGLTDLEGIGYRASSDTLLVVDSGANESVNEFTKDGFLLRRIDIGAAQMPPTGFVPSDVDLAPASNGSGSTNLYIVDRGTDNGNTADCVSPPMDGRLYEMSTPFNNLAPFVDAGTDQSVTLAAGATLDGFVVDDGQPTPGAVTATWSKVSGPGTVTFANANDPDTTVTFGAAGTYVLALTGDDGPNETTDTVQVTVDTDPVVNQAPVVSAGTDQAVTLGTPAALDGTITDDGLPNPPAATTATWTVVSGPGAVTFTDASNVDTSAAFGAVGTYVLQLAGNDSLLETTDTVQVTVNTPGGGGGRRRRRRRSAATGGRIDLHRRFVPHPRDPLR